MSLPLLLFLLLIGTIAFLYHRLSKVEAELTSLQRSSYIYATLEDLENLSESIEGLEKKQMSITSKLQEMSQDFSQNLKTRNRGPEKASTYWEDESQEMQEDFSEEGEGVTSDEDEPAGESVAGNLHALSSGGQLQAILSSVASAFENMQRRAPTAAKPQKSCEGRRDEKVGPQLLAISETPDLEMDDKSSSCESVGRAV